MSLLTAWCDKKGRYFVQDCGCKLNTVKYLRATIYSPVLPLDKILVFYH